MALFKTNKKETEAKKDVSVDKEKNKTVAKKAKVVEVVKTTKDVKPKIRPHVTEKATFLSEKGVYVFRIKPEINKIMMKSFIKKTYGVEPVKIGIVNSPVKTVFLRKRRVLKSGYRKAMVYLKKGDKISIAQ
ncbi:MAG: 50S ribosomal protein L23 [bacterium]|nr:50S ribosomal protein L23 [bacterium]